MGAAGVGRLHYRSGSRPRRPRRCPMAELGLDQWYLSTEAGERGPMPWTLLEQTVRAARAEDSASVRRADSKAWTAFHAMAVATAPTAVLAQPARPAPPAPVAPPAAV